MTLVDKPWMILQDVPDMHLVYPFPYIIYHSLLNRDYTVVDRRENHRTWAKSLRQLSQKFGVYIRQQAVTVVPNNTVLQRFPRWRERKITFYFAFNRLVWNFGFHYFCHITAKS